MSAGILSNLSSNESRGNQLLPENLIRTQNMSPIPEPSSGITAADHAIASMTDSPSDCCITDATSEKAE